jgi:hypothetical protein
MERMDSNVIKAQSRYGIKIEGPVLYLLFVLATVLGTGGSKS